MTPIQRSHHSQLPHILAVLYAAAIVFASLQPFGPWLAPPQGTPFWPLAPDLRTTRFDGLLNVIAYLPLGLFTGLVPRRAHPWKRTAAGALAGFALSFAMESAQAWLPTRDASLIDWITNTSGAALGGALAGWLARSPRLKRALVDARNRWFLPGRIGDAGLALLALWLVAQSNPGVGLFATTFDPAVAPSAAAMPREFASFAVDAAESMLQAFGVGLFVALLLRDRRHFGMAMIALIAIATFAKGITSVAMLRPAPWQSWLRPEVSLGVAAGVLLLLATTSLARPVLVVSSAVALLLSVILPPLFIETTGAPGALPLFNWRHGQLLNFNGLTHAVLLAWPLAAAAWLGALAGRPGWGAVASPADAPMAPRRQGGT